MPLLLQLLNVQLLHRRAPASACWGWAAVWQSVGAVQCLMVPHGPVTTKKHPLTAPWPHLQLQGRTLLALRQPRQLQLGLLEVTRQVQLWTGRENVKNGVEGNEAG